MNNVFVIYNSLKDTMSTKIVITNFGKKIRKWSFIFFERIDLIKDVCKKLTN